MNTISVSPQSWGRDIKVTWIHPKTGLEAEMNYKEFEDTGVLEFGGRLFNRSSKTIRQVKGPFSLYIERQEVEGVGTAKITTVDGGQRTEGAFPPPAYKVNETELTQMGGLNLLCGREGGSSTETIIPSAIVTDTITDYGFFFAYEWPCRSIIQISIQPMGGNRRALSLWAHPGWTCFDMEPGSSVVIPVMNLGFFNGDSLVGSNAMRRHIVRHVIRPVQGGSPLPPVFYNHYYGFTDAWNVSDLKREADAYAELGMEYFVVDAGWFKGGFREGIGNWDYVDPKRFPDGMEAFARYVELKGMKFGSWLEPEFAMKGTDWPKRHPKWFRSAGYLQTPWYAGGRFRDLQLRLDDSSVRGQVADWLESWVNRYHIQWLRWDFNHQPLPFWVANESENQTGRLHLGYGDGLLQLRDELMERCPQVHLEHCAGGGTRTDLSMLRRAHSQWMNDNSSTVPAIRKFLAGLNRVFPGNYGNSCFLWATHKGQRVQTLSSLKRDGYPPYVMRSRMAGTLGFAEQSYLWSSRDKAYLKSEVEKYKSIRRLIMEDYYPLFAPTSIQAYDGWQFHDPKTGEGTVMVFRSESPKSKMEVELGGVRRGDTVELMDMDTDRKQTVKGGKALPVSIPEINGTRWLRYQMK
ncbi:MAG: alpha-galactosidase [Kiritimatiellae bacterium]|nr:alpha-galactosidase [Verrucomicrobiota bacterium]MCG2660539.1 alpha-galactosidase [Kiritimatiellia bacterium]